MKQTRDEHPNPTGTWGLRSPAHQAIERLASGRTDNALGCRDGPGGKRILSCPGRPTTVAGQKWRELRSRHSIFTFQLQVSSGSRALVSARSLEVGAQILSGKGGENL
jgi:hypothetical protein